MTILSPRRQVIFLALLQFFQGGHPKLGDEPWFKSARYYWSLDDIDINKKLVDVKGYSDSKVLGGADTVEGVSKNALRLDGAFSTGADLGNFSKTCISEPDRCKLGFTITFWMKLDASELRTTVAVLQISTNRHSIGTTLYARRNKIGLSVNTRNVSQKVETPWMHTDWVQVTLGWNRITQNVTLLLNCTTAPNLKRTKTIKRNVLLMAPPQDRLMLGANYGFLRNSRVIIDELAVWFDVLTPEDICYIKNAKAADGGFTEWSEFSPCSVSCAKGTKTRTRKCTNPPPQHGGLNCTVIGPFSITDSCFLRYCPIDGNYTTWSEYSGCTKSCGGGTQHRTRVCTNPSPQYGGRNCSRYGPPVDTRDCNTQHCPIDGGYTNWSNFTECSVTCGDGTQTRTRSCTNPKPQYGGKSCTKLYGPSKESKFCYIKICPVDGFYGKWSTYTRCSATCGGGTASRSRLCNSPAPVGEGRNCSRLGPAAESKECNTQQCPIDGGYTQWTSYNNCSSTCNGGIQTRTRNCTSPSPLAGGKDCSLLGPSQETQSCNRQPCPVHGAYGPWASFTPCSATCGGGSMVRKRYCNNPLPMYGGRNCSRLGSSDESKGCSSNKCPDITFVTTVNFPDERFKATLYTKSSEDFKRLARKITWNARQIYGINSALEDVVVKFCDTDDNEVGIQCMIEFMFRSKGFNSAIKLQDALQRRFMLYQMPAKSYFISSNDVPWQAPTHVIAYNTSSTSLEVRWIPSEKSELQDVRGFRIMYRDELRNTYNKILNGLDNTWTTLRGLRKYHYYCIRIMAYSRRGDGLASSPVCAYTDMDVPTGAPTNLNTSSPIPTSLDITWRPVDRESTHGDLLGYKVKYKIFNTSRTFHVSNSSYSGIVDSGPSDLKVTVNDLQKFSRYEIKVAAYNAKGLGPWSKQITPFTSEDAPGKPPRVINVVNTSSTSLEITWLAIPDQFLNGDLKGYRVVYREPSVAGNEDDWESVYVGPDAYSAVLTGLRKFATYVVQVAGFNKAGESDPSKGILATTDEDVPSLPPQNVTVANTSSTSVLVQWSPVPSDHQNGVIQGYIIFYKVSGGNQNFSEQYAIADTSATEVRGLWRFTHYEVQVAAYTSKGEGERSDTVTVSTAEHVPSKPPKLLHLYNTSSTNLHLRWHPIPIKYMHGNLIGYRVLYRPMNASVDNYKVLEYGPGTFQADIVSLLKYTEYGVRVLGFTRIGYGAVSEEEIIRTDEDVPSWPPELVTATNKSSPTTVPIHWRPISDAYYIHGILRGYKVTFWAVKNPNREFEMKKITLLVGPKSHSIVLKGLSPHTVYKVQVLAYTSKGNGTPSTVINAETCNCHAVLYTNWWINPPYLGVNLTGIFPPILNSAVDQCCGHCIEYGRTIISFKSTGNGTSPQKVGEMAVKQAIENQTELSFPVYGRMEQKKYGSFGFVPMVESAGIVFMTIGPEAGAAAKMLVYSVFDLWPMCMVVFVSAFFSGIFMWLLDTWNNQNMFPRSPFRGPMEGMWWAFITMTTLGFGDRVPKNYHSKIFCILWITCGLVIISLFMSFITTSLTTEVMESEPMIYGSKIATIENSSEFRLGIRMNARFEKGVKYRNLMDVYKALKSRSVDGALIDSYTVGSRQDLFGDKELRVSKVFNHASSYGVVLAGEAIKLQKCVTKFMKEERAQVFKSITDNVRPLEGVSTGGAEDMTSSLFDAESEMFKQSLMWSTGMLGALTVVCCIYELLTRKKRKPSPQRYDYSTKALLPNANAHDVHYDQHREEMLGVVKEFHTNCSKIREQLRAKHLRELKLLRRLKAEALNPGDSEGKTKVSFKDAPFRFIRLIQRLWQ